jgi:hypothetical protein
MRSQVDSLKLAIAKTGDASGKLSTHQIERLQTRVLSEGEFATSTKSARPKSEGGPVREHSEPVQDSLEIRVQKTDLVTSSRRTSREWIFELTVTLANGRVYEPASGQVLLDSNGLPEGGPDFYFDKRVVIDGVTKKFQIYDGDHYVPFSDFALDAAIEKFKQDFGHTPDTLPGHLAFENKTNFQREYARAVIGGAGHEDALQVAIKSVSFGRARIARGYDEFTVRAGPMGRLDLGPPLGIQNVPVSVDVEARRKSK